MRLLLSLAFLAGHCSALLQRIHVVVNPFGGGGAGLAALDAVLPIFEKAGIQVTTLETQYAGHAGDFAESVELLDGFVAIGGDGTAHEIANAMLRRQESDRVPVGIIPAGSGVILCRCSNLSKPHAVHVALCLPQPSALTSPNARATRVWEGSVRQRGLPRSEYPVRRPHRRDQPRLFWLVAWRRGRAV